ncbi:MAG: thiamine ABC transporter substrate-binding protein [Candidatus Diapherotrites archaeon]|uniref:Thiamine ABC transporter substrate-binding protein n=1 Tax=Candidatus Iainarchaeum sp. TaxID=3101447 RepID=A0A8T3YNW5_9ARCH|nr:thiamine ABC transporter substrate-binding protein [Candidatus Diapherotrites archaeon]
MFPGKRFLLVLAVFALLFAGCVQQGGVRQDMNASGPDGAGKAAEPRELVVYTYDSMASEYGIGPQIVPKFEAKCGCKVKMIAKGDAGQVLASLVLEKGNPRADVIVGIDNSLLSRAVKSGVVEKFTPRNMSIVPERLRFDKEGHFTPYDFGYFAFVYDSNKVRDLNSFDSLLRAQLERKIAVQNPRTSSPGLGLLLWTVAVYGDPGYKGFWQKFRKSVLSVTAGWDESAGMFSAGEVPVYLSYSTSPPYYAEFEGRPEFVAGEFMEGHYVQVEGMGIVKGAKNRGLAEQFIEFSLTPDFQGEVPLNQFMFPVNESVELPESFKYAFKPARQLELDPALVEEKQEEWISEWEKIMKSG